MKTFIAAIAVLALTSVSAIAGPPSGHKSGHHHSNSYSPSVQVKYNVTYGKQFTYGWYYPGKIHSHWSYQSYWPKYGCNTYWCPSTCSYYYWYEPAGCYYPISYITKATPVFVSGPVVATLPPAGIPVLPK